MPYPIFDKIMSLENLEAAYIKAMRGKTNRSRYYLYSLQYYSRIRRLRDHVLNGTYVSQPSVEFDLWCISGQKVRHISVPTLDDLVLQHAIYNVIYPIISPRLIYDSYGCRKYKGTHRAADRCQEFLRASSPDSYYLQIDIRKYYYSLDHQILRSILLRFLQDEKAVDLTMSQFPQDTDVGMNVGALISQVMGIIYLDRFDHYCKRVLKVKHYIRYVDDVVMIGMTKERCHEVLAQVESFLANDLKLELSKAKINPISKGINFVGYRAWQGKRIIRKRSMKQFNKSLRKGKLLSVQASLAHAKRTSSYTGMMLKARTVFSNLSLNGGTTRD